MLIQEFIASEPTEDLKVMFWVATSLLLVPRLLVLAGRYSGHLR